MHKTHKSILYSDFLSFHLKSFLCSRILSKIPHCIYLSCRLRFLLAVTVTDFTARYFAECPSIGICLEFFSGSLVIKRKTTQVKCHLHYIMSRVHTVYTICRWLLTLIVWLRKCLPGSVKSPLWFSPSTWYALEGSHDVPFTLKEYEIPYFLLEERVFT